MRYITQCLYFLCSEKYSADIALDIVLSASIIMSVSTIGQKRVLVTIWFSLDSVFVSVKEVGFPILSSRPLSFDQVVIPKPEVKCLRDRREK